MFQIAKHGILRWQEIGFEGQNIGWGSKTWILKAKIGLVGHKMAIGGAMFGYVEEFWWNCADVFCKTWYGRIDFWHLFGLVQNSEPLQLQIFSCVRFDIFSFGLAEKVKTLVSIYCHVRVAVYECSHSWRSNRYVDPSRFPKSSLIPYTSNLPREMLPIICWKMLKNGKKSPPKNHGFRLFSERDAWIQVNGDPLAKKHGESSRWVYVQE